MQALYERLLMLSRKKIFNDGLLGGSLLEITLVALLVRLPGKGFLKKKVCKGRLLNRAALSGTLVAPSRSGS